MRIKPIPRRLLIHTIKYEEFLRDGSFGDEFAEPVSFSFVRMEPKSSFRRNANGEEINLQGVLFLDAQNTPDYQRLKEKSKVHFKGREMRVYACEEYYAFDGKTPHHYEVELQ
ncbi:putative minor capsid protein [Bacillus sp. JCM 19041]|uniref:putative minor capsid protein n=1 Tax=Bacillus sp. JCM 19041 TaxID=1460637 RepID=UPI000B1B42DC